MNPALTPLPSVPDPSDNELMFDVQAGRLDRLGVLFERHHVGLYTYFLRLTQRPNRSEDLVQETFERILKYRHSFRGDGPFAAWMYQMARNVFRDDLRRHRHETPLDEETAAAQPSPEPPLLDRLQHDSEVALLERALHALPESKREVLILSRFHDLKYADVARILGCTVGAVKVRVHRALNDLRTIYAQLANEANV